MTDHDQTAVMPRIRDWVPGRHDPWGEDPAESGVVGSHRAYRSPVYPWLVPGVVMAVVGAVGVGRPGLWADELATWGMVGLSRDDGLAVLRYVDAVLGPYYALAWGCAQLFGDSDAALRAPSVVAMAFAAALTGAVGSRLAGARVGLFAGLVLAVLPGASRFAQEARPYAMTVCAAALTTYVFVRLLQRPRWYWFAAYVPAVALLGLCHVVALLILAGHGWIVLARLRRHAVAWTASAVLGTLPALPLLWLGNTQKAQVAWIGQFRPGPEVYLETGFGLVAVAAVVGGLALFGLPLRFPISVCTAWAVVPVAALYAVSQLMPLLLPRYLLFTLPAWALLAGAALARPHPALSAVVLVGIAALSVPAHLYIRSDAGHDEDTRTVAAVITERYRPGDGIVYAAGDVAVGAGWVPRDTVAHYVPADRRPRDVLLRRPQRTEGQLLAAECADAAACLGDPPRLWVVRLGYREDPLTGLGDGKEALVRGRYRQEQVWRPKGFTVGLVVAARPAT